MKHVILALPLFLLGACGTSDPYTRTDSWSLSGANEKNISAMVVNPRDLVSGHGGGRVGAVQAVMAADRIWQDRPKPLLDTAKSGPSGGGGATPAPPN